MCLVVLAFGVDPEFPLIVAGNRDEFHARPTQAAHWWSNAPDIVGGRDLQAGGTWLALHRNGRFATVTNFRDLEKPDRRHRSRGHLVTEFLQSELSPVDYLRSVDAAAYSGFNLLVSDGASLAYLCNRDGGVEELAAGIYGLSNATLETTWEKSERSKNRLQGLISSGRSNETELLRLLADREKGPASEVHGQKLPFATAHAVTAPFIVLPDYGTRCSTVVQGSRGGKVTFVERRFDAAGNTEGESRYSWQRAVDPE